jgi:tetratricopeptide (TPR) repeat protein
MAANDDKKPAPKVDPLRSLEAVLDRAREAEARGDLGAALAAIDGAPEECRGLATLHFARGTLLVKKGQIERAIEAMREAVRLEPEVPEFKANLGAALVEKARRANDAATLARAIDVLEEAALAGPKTALVHGNLGMALQTAGRYDEALAAFDRALEIEPRDVTSLYNRAATLHLLGREEDALAALDATLAVDPAFPPAIRSRANTLRRLGRAG